jgi:hypothetical protein
LNKSAVKQLNIDNPIVHKRIMDILSELEKRDIAYKGILSTFMESLSQPPTEVPLQLSKKAKWGVARNVLGNILTDKTSGKSGQVISRLTSMALQVQRARQTLAKRVQEAERQYTEMHQKLIVKQQQEKAAELKRRYEEMMEAQRKADEEYERIQRAKLQKAQAVQQSTSQSRPSSSSSGMDSNDLAALQGVLTVGAIVVGGFFEFLGGLASLA